MKTNAIVRIVLFSIAILVLLGILVTGLLIDMFQFDTSTEGQNLPVAFDGVTSQGAVGAEEVLNLDIEWIAGSITIMPVENTDQITIAETGNDNEKYAMVYSQTGNTLNIQYCKESIQFPSLGLNVSVTKDLLITVPADWTCNELSIDTASADLNITDLKINEVDIDDASGVCRFENCTVGKISMDSASGDLDFAGYLYKLDFEGASANCRISVTNIPSEIDIDSASGNSELYLPENCGFTCTLSSMSGNFESEFETITRKGSHVHGDGSCVINVDALSGNVRIHKN